MRHCLRERPRVRARAQDRCDEGGSGSRPSHPPPSNHPATHPATTPSLHPSVHPSIPPSVHHSLPPSTTLSPHPPIHPHLSIHLNTQGLLRDYNTLDCRSKRGSEKSDIKTIHKQATANCGTCRHCEQTLSARDLDAGKLARKFPGDDQRLN